MIILIMLFLFLPTLAFSEERNLYNEYLQQKQQEEYIQLIRNQQKLQEQELEIRRRESLQNSRNQIVSDIPSFDYSAFDKPTYRVADTLNNNVTCHRLQDGGYFCQQ